MTLIAAGLPPDNLKDLIPYIKANKRSSISVTPAGGCLPSVRAVVHVGDPDRHDDDPLRGDGARDDRAHGADRSHVRPDHQTPPRSRRQGQGLRVTTRSACPRYRTSRRSKAGLKGSRSRYAGLYAPRHSKPVSTRCVRAANLGKGPPLRLALRSWARSRCRSRRPPRRTAKAPQGRIDKWGPIIKAAASTPIDRIRRRAAIRLFRRTRFILISMPEQTELSPDKQPVGACPFAHVGRCSALNDWIQQAGCLAVT